MTEGWEGIWQKMTDDDDEAGGRREKTLTVRQKMTQDDKGWGRGMEWSKKDDVGYEKPLNINLCYFN